MTRATLRIVHEIFIITLMLATLAMGIVSVVSCVLPPFRLLTFGTTEGSQGRWQFKMLKGAVVVESWTLHAGAADALPKASRGMLGFYYCEGIIQGRLDAGDPIVPYSTQLYQRRIWCCPGAIVAMIFTSIPSFVFWRRGKRTQPGHCACGYDLTGNVSGRCPECGEATDGAVTIRMERKP